MVQFLKSATKFSKDAVLKLENATGKLLLDGQHIVTITKQKLTIAKGVLIESIDDNLKPIGELVTPDGYTLSMSDGRSLNERVLSIVEDAKGKYKIADSKLDNPLIPGIRSIEDVLGNLKNSPTWIRENNDLLQKLLRESDEFIKKVDDFYAKTMSKQTPANFNGEGVYGSVHYNKYGFPDFEKFGQTLNKKYIFKNAKGNRTTDYIEARDWIKKQEGVEAIKDLGSGTPLLVLIKGQWKKITWHHHENGKDLLPVLSEFHSVKHTGGVKTKALGIEKLFEYE